MSGARMQAVPFGSSDLMLALSEGEQRRVAEVPNAMPLAYPRFNPLFGLSVL